jgi:hypothetical protein
MSGLREQYMTIMAHAMDGNPIFFRFGDWEASTN